MEGSREAERLHRVLKKYGIATTMCPHTSLRCLLVHPNDKVELEEQGELVYPIPARTEVSSILERQGETGRDRERQGETGRYRERQGETGRDRERQGETGRDRERQGETGRLLKHYWTNTERQHEDEKIH